MWGSRASLSLRWNEVVGILYLEESELIVLLCIYWLYSVTFVLCVFVYLCPNAFFLASFVVMWSMTVIFPVPRL